MFLPLFSLFLVFELGVKAGFAALLTTFADL